ncbi:MAG: hypothetical protein HRT61_18485, partial [Ekhidna sp.]|nr:hypothetical protein [Ekhidna sp.]
DTYEASEWTADPETGLPNITVGLTAPEALTLLNLTTDDIDGGDTFRFEWTLNLTNGKSFNRFNSSSSLPSWPFYDAPFLLDVNVICSVPDTYALGSYTLTQNTGGVFGAVFANSDIVVELVPGETSTQRTFEAEYLQQFAIGQGPNPFSFNLVCERAIFVNGQPTGLQCSSGLIFGAADNPGSYDPSDDSVIQLTIKENTGSDCGGGPVDVSFTLTKN